MSKLLASSARRLGRAGVLVVVLGLLGILARADVPKGQTFRLDTTGIDPKPRTVHLAGSFNGWNSSATPMSDPDGDGTWEVTVPLEEGTHLYKFVLDGNRWMPDPAGDKSLEEPDGYGGMNSGIIVGPDARKLPPPQPKAINLDGILHNPNDAFDLNVVDARTLRVRVRTQADDVQRIDLRIDEGNDVRRVPLHKLGVERGFDVWGGVATTSVASVRYWFELFDDVQVIVSAENKLLVPEGVRLAKPVGFAVEMKPTFITPDWARDVVWYQVFPERFRNGDPTNDPGDFWYENLVPWNGDWFADLPGEVPASGPTLDEDNFYRGTGDVWRRRYGGDIAGIREKLPYLRELGVTAIYLNPIFEAESMHKYDTADFRHVDDNFGVRDEPSTPVAGSQKPIEPWKPIGNRKLFNLDGTPVPDDHVETDDPNTWRWTKSDLLFLDFLREARRQGFHVIIDGVFNHVGRAHPFFQDVIRNGPNSAYADWFEIEAWPDTLPAKEEDFGKPGGLRFRAWDGPSGHLPVFRKDGDRGLAKGPREHIMAITRRWLDPDGNPETRDGVDGWRLDVPGDIPHPFWIEWRKLVKAANPDAYITGEIWTAAQPWINQGDQFDAVMNYQFALAMQQFFANQRDVLSPAQMNERLVRLQFMYPFQAALVMQNLLDSHDTDRAASWFVNPDRPYDGQNRPQDNAREIGYDHRAPNDNEWARYRQMIAFQMLFVGAPMIYYGNEAGMWSADDPSNRQPLPWSDKGPYANGVGFDRDLFDHYRRAIAVRNALPALQRGFYHPLKIDNEAGVLVFARSLDGKSVLAAINRGNQPITVSIPVERAGKYRDWLDPEQAELKFDDTTPQARSTLKPVGEPRHVAKDNAIELTLKPWQTVVLSAE